MTSQLLDFISWVAMAWRYLELSGRMGECINANFLPHLIVVTSMSLSSVSSSSSSSSNSS